MRLSYTRAHLGLMVQLISLISLITLGAPQRSAAEESRQTKLSKAQRLIEEGNAHFKRKAYRKGISVYQEAQRVIPDVKNLFVIATAFGYLPDQCRETLEAWSAFFKSCSGACRYHQSALERHEQQRARCYVSLKISSSTPNLSISHQAESWGQGTTQVRELIAQPYRGVTFSAPGHHSITRDIELKPEQGSVELSVALVPILEPSFLDRNRALLGGVTSALALGSIFYSMGQVDQYNAALSQAAALQAEASPLTTEDQFKYNSLKVQLAQRRAEGSSAQIGFWVGIGGAVALSGLSAWIWLKEPDVKQDPNRSPRFEILSSLRWSVTPLGGALSLRF